MNSLYKGLITLLCSPLLSACVTMQLEPIPLTQVKVNKFTVGMDKNALNRLLAHNKANYTFTKQYENVAYQITGYDLITTTESVLEMNCDYRGPCIPVDVEEVITTAFLLIQSQPALTLVDWGTLEELRKSEDKRTQALIMWLDQTKLSP